MEPHDAHITFNAHIFRLGSVAEERMTMKQARFKVRSELSPLLNDLFGGDFEFDILVVTPEIAERDNCRQPHDVDIFCKAHVTSSELITQRLTCTQEANQFVRLLIWKRLRDLFQGEVEIDLSVDVPKTA